MITGELRSKVDSIWDTIWTGGITNPIIVIMNVHGIVALAVIHKVSAVLFMVLINVLLTRKAAMNKKA